MLAAILGLATLPAGAQAPPVKSVPPAVSRIEANVVYGMYSGLALLMDVYRPAVPNGFGVLYVPGNGWTAPRGWDAPQLKETRGPQFQVFTEPLLEAGYAVFVINHRAGPRFHYPAAVEDAQRAIRFIRYNARSYGIDPAHVGAVGYSSGGYLVSMLGVQEGKGDPAAADPVERESARVQCVVAGGAPEDLASLKSPDAVALLSDFLDYPVLSPGIRGADSFLYAQASPMHYVSADDPPFLLLHGSGDTLIPPDQADSMQQALLKAGVPTQLLLVPGATHESMFLGAQTVYTTALVQWLDLYLRGIKPEPEEKPKPQ